MVVRKQPTRKRKDAAYWRAYYQKNKAKRSAQSKKWRDANIDRVRAYRRERQRIGYKKNTAAHRVSISAWKNENPEAVKAHSAVRQAIKSGKLSRGPCADCGCGGKTEGHHEDYSKPLDVIWLCRICHDLRHSLPARRIGGIA